MNIAPLVQKIADAIQGLTDVAGWQVMEEAVDQDEVETLTGKDARVGRVGNYEASSVTSARAFDIGSVDVHARVGVCEEMARVCARPACQIEYARPVLNVEAR